MNWIEWAVMISLAAALIYFYGAALYYHKKYNELLEKKSLDSLDWVDQAIKAREKRQSKD